MLASVPQLHYRLVFIRSRLGARGEHCRSKYLRRGVPTVWVADVPCTQPALGINACRIRCARHGAHPLLIV